jgi:hypothetical protein
VSPEREDVARCLLQAKADAEALFVQWDKEVVDA